MTDNVKFLFGSNDVHNLATLTATSEALDVDNTKNSYRDSLWRSTSLADQTITGTLASDYTATDLVVNRHNLSSAATLQLILKDGGSGGTTEYDSGAVAFTDLIEIGTFEFGVDPWGGAYSEPWGLKALTMSFASTTFDYYEIVMSDAANTAGFLQVGQVMLGTTFQPANNFNRGAILEYLDGTILTRTDGGSLRAEGTSETYRRLTLNLDWLEQSDRNTLISETGRAGRGIDIFVSGFPNDGTLKEAHFSFIAKRSRDIRLIDSANGPNYDKTQLIFDEV